MSNRDELHVLTGAYAVDALTGEELAEFERYLAESEEARTEVVGMTETAVLLGSVAAPVTPSAQLKESLLALIATTEQLPPLPGAGAGAVAGLEPRRETGAPRPDAATELPIRGEAVPLVGQERGRQSAQSKAKARWFARPTPVIAAAAAAAALFFGGNVVINSLQQADTVRTEAGALASLTTAADLQTQVQPVAGGGKATLVWSGQLGRSALVLSDLPTLDLGKTYEAWYISTSGARPAGTFDATAGDTWHVLEGSMSKADAIGVTVEPAGGSQQPTTKPIVALPTQ